MFTKSGRLIILNTLFGIWGASPGRQYRLSTNIPGGSPDDVVEADFTEATFPGYAQISDPANADATLDAFDRGRIFTPTLTWTAGAIVTPETCKCIYIVSTSTSANIDGLVWWKELAAWVTVANPGEQINQVVTIYDRDFVP